MEATNHIRPGRRALAMAAATATTLAIAIGGLGAASAAPIPHGQGPVNLDPAEFTTQIDNPFFPLVPGTRLVYREQDAAGVGPVLELSASGGTDRVTLMRVGNG